MDISNFVLERSVIECRYAQNYRMWDSAGAITTSLQEEIPGLDVVSAQPNHIVFRISSAHVKFEIELGKIAFASFNPASDTKPAVYCQQVLNIIADTIGIELIERIGYRTYYFNQYKDVHSVTEALLGLSIFNIPEPPILNVDGRCYGIDLKYRIEDDSLGATIHIQSASKSGKLSPDESQKWLLEKEISKEVFGVLLDIDSYTTASIETAGVDLPSFCEDVERLVRRDLNSFIK